MPFDFYFMYIKFFLNAIWVILLSIFQIAFVGGLPAPFSRVNFLLIALAAAIFLFGLERALWWAIGSGFLLDIYTFSPFGMRAVGLSAAVILSYLLLVNFFTNKSLYSFLIITVFAGVFYEIYIALFGFAFSFFGDDRFSPAPAPDFFMDNLEKILLNIAAAALIFYAVNFMSKKMKPVFLEKK